MVLSEYRKRLEKIFQNTVISAISQNDENLKNIFPPAFFNILKEPLLVQKQTIPQKKALILSFLQLESLRAWHYQEGSTPTCRKKTLKKKVNLTEESQDAKKKNLIAPILFLYYEESVCPLLLKYNKVYFVSSLIAKPTLAAFKIRLFTKLFFTVTWTVLLSATK